MQTQEKQPQLSELLTLPMAAKIYPGGESTEQTFRKYVTRGRARHKQQGDSDMQTNDAGPVSGAAGGLHPCHLATVKPEGQMAGFVKFAGPAAPARPEAVEAVESHCGGKAPSSRCARISLIPREALVRLAERFELGLKNHGERAWNALSGNQEILTDLNFLSARIDHALVHLLSLADKVAKAKHTGRFELGDDDSAAIAFFGAFACCATKAMLDSQADRLGSIDGVALGISVAERT